LPDHYASRVLLAFEALTQNPAPAPEYDIKKLARTYNMYSLRIGDIGIEYDVD